MSHNPFVGQWIYRSFINNPNLDTDFRDLEFGRAYITIAEPSDNVLAGEIGSADWSTENQFNWSLNLSGKFTPGEHGVPYTAEFTGIGTVFGEEWNYEYLGYYVPNWPHGVNQRDAFVGSVMRAKDHGQSKAGVVCSFVAVRAEPRRSISDLNEDELQDLLRAFKTIQELPNDDENSFYTLAAIHAAPYPKDQLGKTWCHHGTVLFPTWHRPYMERMERALRKYIPKAKQSTFRLPYWDQTSGDIPGIFLQSQVTIDGVLVHNPLFSYAPTVDITSVNDKNEEYVAIPKGAHTARGFTWIQDAETRTHFYLKNLRTALVQNITPAFKRCLETLEWKYFSNSQYDRRTSQSVETPHNWVHNYSGGYPLSNIDWTGIPLTEPVPASQEALNNSALFQRYKAAGNSTTDFEKWDSTEEPARLALWVDVHYSVMPPHESSMSNVDISSYDPLFYFHHANIDRFYWQWQQYHGVENWKPDPPPANPNDPDPFNPGNNRDINQKDRLSLETPLPPFPFIAADVKSPNSFGVIFTPVTITSQRAPLETVVFNANKTEHSGTKIKARVFEETSEGKLRLLGSDMAFTRIYSGSCPNCVANPNVPLHVVLAHHSEGFAELFASRSKADRKLIGGVAGISSLQPVEVTYVA